MAQTRPFCTKNRSPRRCLHPYIIFSHPGNSTHPHQLVIQQISLLQSLEDAVLEQGQQTPTRSLFWRVLAAILLTYIP